jgi:hypothetical protein
MPELPPDPIEATEFLEDFVPGAFAELAGGRRLPETDLELGFQLLGEGGGEWVYRVRDGALDVVRTGRDHATVTVIQSVEDWRGALWEGRGGIFGRTASAVLSGAAFETLREAAGDREPSFEPLEPIRALEGLVRVVLAGDAGGDWSLAVKLGPGEIPSEPSATVTIQADDAAAIERRELDPLQAFMAGRIQVVGDMTLVLQMQAVLMQAVMRPPR